MRQPFEAAVSWSYDSPAKGGLHHAHYPGRVANRIDFLKWTSRAAAPVFAIMLCGSNSARAAASQSQIPCADGLSHQRIHVTLRKPTKPRKPANKKSSPKWDLLQGNLAEGGEKEVQHK